MDLDSAIESTLNIIRPVLMALHLHVVYAAVRHEYDITLTEVNTKLSRSGPSVNDARRTIAIGRALLHTSCDY